MQPRVRAVEIENADTTFLGPIYARDVSAVQASSTKWTKSIEVNKCMVTFEIDTGADVTMIPENFYRKTHDGPLQPTKCQLTGAGQQPLKVQGHFKVYLQYKNSETEQEIFVIRGLS